MRLLVALTTAVLAGFSVAEPAFAAGARGGALPGFRAPFMHAPRVVVRHHPFAVPRGFAHRPTVRPFGTVNSSTPFGTIRPTTPFGTVAASTPFAAVAPVTRFTRLHHRAYHFGWDFPVTSGGDLGYSGYIGMPYDPAEIVPVYGPAPAAEPAEPARAAAPRAENDACRSERVTVPASGGEREITVVRC